MGDRTDIKLLAGLRASVIDEKERLGGRWQEWLLSSASQPPIIHRRRHPVHLLQVRQRQRQVRLHLFCDWGWLVIPPTS